MFNKLFFEINIIIIKDKKYKFYKDEKNLN